MIWWVGITLLNIFVLYALAKFLRKPWREAEAVKLCIVSSAYVLEELKNALKKNGISYRIKSIGQPSLDSDPSLVHIQPRIGEVKVLVQKRDYQKAVVILGTTQSSARQ